MTKNLLKQATMFVISSIGLYYSGLYLTTMDGIKSLFDALNVMIFFTCFFPFLILSISLFRRIIKNFISFLRLTRHLIKTSMF
jgi:Mg2+/citrate symporter